MRYIILAFVLIAVLLKLTHIGTIGKRSIKRYILGQQDVQGSLLDLTCYESVDECQLVLTRRTGRSVLFLPEDANLKLYNLTLSPFYTRIVQVPGVDFVSEHLLSKSQPFDVILLGQHEPSFKWKQLGSSKKTQVIRQYAYAVVKASKARIIVSDLIPGEYAVQADTLLNLWLNGYYRWVAKYVWQEENKIQRTDQHVDTIFGSFGVHKEFYTL